MAAGLLVYLCWAGEKNGCWTPCFVLLLPDWCLPRCRWPHVDFFVGFVALLSATMLLAPFSVVCTFFCDLLVLSDCSVVASLTSFRFCG